MKKAMNAMSFFPAALICAFLFCGGNGPTSPLRPTIVDFAPIQVGNTWVYKNTFIGLGYAVGISNNFIRTISVSKTARDVVDTTILIFNATVHDSGIANLGHGDSAFDTTYSIDSIIKTQDTITSAGSLSGYFLLSKKENTTFNYVDSFSVRHWGRFYSYNNLIAYSNGNMTVVYIGGALTDSSVYLENVGLIYSYYSIWYHQGIGSENTIRLISFNGRTPEQISQIARR
jgi:hypothetical protein